jgi:four helix bundle protein
MRDFRKLEVWKKAFPLVKDVYRRTEGFPPDERYGLVRQMRGAAVSACANVAEGCARGGEADFRRFLEIAKGSANELRCYVLLGRDLGYPASGAGGTDPQASIPDFPASDFMLRIWLPASGLLSVDVAPRERG